MTPTLTEAPPPGSTAHAPWWRQAREFFAYHGVWAIGVRVMRVWSLRTKMALIVAVLALPLLPLMASAILDRHATVARSGHRLAGLQVAEAASALAHQLDGQRQALENRQAPPPDALAPALQALQRATAGAVAAGVYLDGVLRKHQAVLDRVTAPGADPAGPHLASLPAARAALVDIRASAILASQLLLTADPLQDAHASLVAERLPALHRELSMVRGQATRLAGLLDKDPRPAAEQHAALVALAGSTEAADRLVLQCEGLLNALHGSPLAAGDASLAASRSALAQVRATLLAPAAAADLPALQGLVASAVQQITGLQARLQGQLADQLRRQQADARQQRQALLAALALSVGLAAYLMYSFFLVMRGGLGALDQQMSRVARGDLTGRPLPHGGDEVARVMQAMTVSLARLSDLLATVRQGVGAMAQASNQIADGNADLTGRGQRAGQGMQALAADVRRTATELSDCTRAVESVVTTVQALRLASVRNRRQMQRLQERMTSLRGKSQEIGEIVSLIDTIAFRTNILALNASVEACKAGEAGRGFAVVAQEVRALATRSAESARRIGSIVGSSTAEIEQSGALADETGRSITESDGHAEAIHGAMTRVAELTHRGDLASAGLLRQIQSLTEQTGENLGLGAQLAGASDALRGQGERLGHRVAQFKLS